VSTTTRRAGGLDFTAEGGKRQGREVSQSLRIWKTQSSKSFEPLINGNNRSRWSEFFNFYPAK
jgi:hypothetical protein